jgi:site-specific recombinase XerD
MTPLRAKYIRDLVIRGRSKHTQEAYTRYVRDLARYYRRSPELISYEEVTGWLYHLIKERQLSASSVNIAVSAVRFLYAVTLGRETLDLMASVPHMKRATPRAEVYARSEVEAILIAPRQPRDPVFLMTVYGCGLRISEATQLRQSPLGLSGYTAFFVSSAKPGLGHLGVIRAAYIGLMDLLARAQSYFSNLLLRSNPSSPQSALHRSRYFTHT